jgi:DNA-binding transcriptional MerR regulator
MKTVKDVAKEMNISEHTLRFWDKEGLLPPVGRDKNNIRIFSEQDLQWVFIIKCLRGGGVQLADIKKYIALCQIGDSTVLERFEIIKEAKRKTLEQLDELNHQLAKLNYKEEYYKNLIENNAHDCCNPANNDLSKYINN